MWNSLLPPPSLSTPSLSLSPNPPCFPHTWTMHYELYFRHTNLLLDIEGCGCVILGVKMRWPSLSCCSLLAGSFRSLECPRITHQVYYWVLQMSMFFLFFCWVVEIWQMMDPFTDISYLKLFLKICITETTRIIFCAFLCHELSIRLEKVIIPCLRRAASYSLKVLVPRIVEQVVL